MLTKKDIQEIINGCRKEGESGRVNGIEAEIQDLNVDFLSPPLDFLGTGCNPAIFINQHTFNLLGKYHQKWRLNKTIAVKEDLLANDTIKIIGIIVHETGHAFNIAANIENTEANAYIFEIEVLVHWFKTNNPLLFNCSPHDLQTYFHSRIPYYLKETGNHAYLAQLVKHIEENKLFNPNPTPSPPRFVIQAPQLRRQTSGVFFKAFPEEIFDESFACDDERGCIQM